MERYTRLLLHFAYSLSKGLNQGVESFVFSTRLTRITRQMRTNSVDRALRDVSAQVPDWSGGTRIGEALKTFNYDWARRVLGRGAVVLLISDGWDQGDPAVLRTEIARLQRSDVDRALREISAKVQDWSGGTRIGEALKTFNYDWARRVLGRGAIVLLISDGWDQGEADVLRAEIARLQRSCYRLIWLNPLLGSPQYEPLTRGMQTALPYIDDFLPVHNLASLQDLAKRLERLDESRPARRRGVDRRRLFNANGANETNGANKN